MVKNRLKQYRVAKGLTQTKLAKQLGVSQPNYQRWESGFAEIPEEKLKKLAFALKATPEQLLGRHPPIEAGFYNDGVGAELNYYGEVSIHFAGGGEPLVLSISDAAFSKLHHDLQTDSSYVWVKSLCNQTVLIRTKAIADLYLASDSSDTYGPEHDDEDSRRYHKNHFAKQIPDNRDWEIIEALENGDTEGYAPEDVKRVQQMIMITDEQYKELVADGRIKPEDLEAEKEKNWKETETCFSYANETRYQLSTGKCRKVWLYESELYSAFTDFAEDLDGEMTGDLIRIEYENQDQYIFLNKHAFDYVMMPTHKFEAGEIDEAAEVIDALGDDEPETKKPAKKPTKKGT
jgi:transcriptional regulator with XRE-family HTH domain